MVGLSMPVADAETVQTPAETADPPDPESAFLGVSLAPFKEVVSAADIAFDPAKRGAVVVMKILPGTAAEGTDLQVNDIVTMFNGRDLPPDHPVKEITAAIKKNNPGDTITLSGFRNTSKITLNGKKVDPGLLQKSLQSALGTKGSWTDAEVRRHVVVKAFSVSIALGRRSDYLTFMELPDLDDVVYRAAAEPTLLATLMAEKWADQHATIEGVTKRHRAEAGRRLPGLCELESRFHREPTKVLDIAERMSTDLAHTTAHDTITLLMRYRTGNGPATTAKPDLPPLPESAEQARSQLWNLLERRIKMRQSLLGTGSAADLKQTAEIARYLHHRYISTAGAKNLPAGVDTLSEALLELEQKWDIDALYQMQRYIMSYFTEKRLRRLAKLLGANETRSYHSSAGTIVIGSSGADYHHSAADLTIDFGGNDIYSTLRESQRKGIIIDCGGDDVYRSTIPFQFGAGFLDVSYLLDIEGNDSYSAPDGSLGSGYFGIGVLEDREGNDRYECDSRSIGIGMFGIGCLLDHAGNDTYMGGYLVEGVGLAGGIGMLWDNAGDDRYIAHGLINSSYKEKKLYDGLSQGFGKGIREEARGGIGIVFDARGDDTYRSGNFSQGTGYFFSAGILIDHAGDDAYHCSRYGLGSSAHDATGIMMDRNGDDTYYSDLHAVCGAGWDRSVALFVDYRGHDRYESRRGFSFGAVDHNGIAYHYDLGGDDTYTNGFYVKQKNDYHGGRSFGAFVNLGGRDTYPKTFENNAMDAHGDFWFIDR